MAWALCCCACGVDKVGEQLIVDTSGIEACLCVDGGDFVTVATAFSMPTEWVCNAVGPNTWLSDIAGSITIYAGGDCENLALVGTFNLPFRVRVDCITTGENMGKFSVTMSITTNSLPSLGAFDGIASGIGLPADNLILCNTSPGPGEQIALFSGGTATISKPV